MLILASLGRPVDFLTSDHHFGHERISGYATRGYDGRLAEMNAMMVQRWNKVVRPRDTVLHLGDFALGQRAETVPVARQLNGEILFMPGNHDGISLLNDPVYAARQRPLYEANFAALLPETGDRLITSAGNEALVSHYPFSDPHAGEAMRRLMPPDEGTVLLVHGHTHQHETLRERRFHVGVDSHDFYPVAAGVVEEWIDANS